MSEPHVEQKVAQARSIELRNEVVRGFSGLLLFRSKSGGGFMSQVLKLNS